MDMSRMRVAEYQVAHRHDDGSFVEMIEAPNRGGPEASDPERAWPQAHLFQCRSCEESVLVAPADADGHLIESR
jgi:hypothetical protein